MGSFNRDRDRSVADTRISMDYFERPRRFVCGLPGCCSRLMLPDFRSLFRSGLDEVLSSTQLNFSKRKHEIRYRDLGRRADGGWVNRPGRYLCAKKCFIRRALMHIWRAIGRGNELDRNERHTTHMHSLMCRCVCGEERKREREKEK